MNLFDDLDKEKEVDVEDEVCKYAKNTYGFGTDKFTSPARRSVPDRLFTYHWFHFFIEFKNPTKPCKATDAQDSDHKKRRARKGLVFVCNDVEKGKDIVDRMWQLYQDILILTQVTEI